MENKTSKQRTTNQNKALHLYFTLLAGQLNEAGLEMKTVLSKQVDVPWSLETIKELLWRPIQKSQVGKRSTTQLTTKEINLIYDTLNRFMAEFGVTQEFPSIEAIIRAMDYNEIDNKK